MFAALVSALGLSLSVAGAQTVVYVDDDADLGGDGTRWETDYKYLREARIGAAAGNEIRVWPSHLQAQPGRSRQRHPRRPGGHVAAHQANLSAGRARPTALRSQIWGDSESVLSALSTPLPHSAEDRSGRAKRPGAIESESLVTAIDKEGTSEPPARGNGSVIFVDLDATGANDGSSWADAFNDLQDALEVAGAGDQIWAVAGRYKPDRETGDREATFLLVDGVGLYGGFAGDEDPETFDLADRDFEANETILSGDLNGNDSDGNSTCCVPHGIPGCNDLACEAAVCAVDPYCCETSWDGGCADLAADLCGNLCTDGGDNSYHVVTSSGTDDTTVLDGFTVTAGNANGSDAWHFGGGLYNDAGSPKVNNCIFKYNSATGWGGGVYSVDGDLALTNCTFSENIAESGVDVGAGGGMANEGGHFTLLNCTFANNVAEFGGGLLNLYGTAVLDNCVFSGNLSAHGAGFESEASDLTTLSGCMFSGNLSTGSGGGLRNFNTHLTATDCTFSGNSVSDKGGGLHNWGNEPGFTMTLIRCTFVENTTDNDGAGLYSSPALEGVDTLINCTFCANAAADIGGGMYKFGSANTFLTHCKFIGNSAGDRYGGGMAINSDCSPTLINCLFTGNSAASHGGAMWNVVNSNPMLINCTFSRNSAGESGGGMYSITRSNPTVLNCVFWGNQDNGGTDESAQIHQEDGWIVVHYSCIQGWTGAFGGIGNFGDDPLFVDADGPDDIPGTQDDNLRLSPGSPALDAGTNIALPNDSLDLDGDADTVELLPVDLAGLPRLLDSLGVPGGEGDPVVDIGAFEGSDDCNGNEVTDATDIADGTSLDCNTNGIPDECEIGVDCNDNGSCDADDVALGESDDCNVNGIPDECEPDCNGNGVADECDIAQATSDDCNGDNIPDECLTSALDCNHNQLVDPCETADGISPDVNGNGRPDECEPPILLVRKGATGLDNGLTWTDAFDNLQRAISIAADSAGLVQEVWVAAAVYTPDGGTGDRNATFLLPDGVAVYGGFVGDETEHDQRDPVAHETILSGDLAGNDEGEFSDFTRLDNAYHIVTSKGTGSGTTLDGFTITSGHATPLAPQDRHRGAGLWNNGEIALANLIFRLNWTIGSSAGMYNNGIANLTKCAFEDNWASVYGGGMLNDGLWPETGVASAVLDRCRFARNFANQGGGLSTHYGALMELSNCEFSANRATGAGGMLANSAGKTTLVNCVFGGNLAGDAAGFQNYQTQSTLINCAFVGNLSSYIGGGVYAYLESIQLTNCILWGNEDSFGSGEAAQIYLVKSLTSFEIDYCDIQGLTGELGGVGNIGDEPFFVHEGHWDDMGTPDDFLDDVWIDGDYHLLPESPCINTGDPDFEPQEGETDLDGHARVLCDRVDMGAYEFGIGDYDCDQAVDLTDFASWESCFTGPAAGSYPEGCEAFDFDFDEDVDLQDFGGFQRVFD